MQEINGKPVFVEHEGEGPAVLFIHGLGGTTNFYEPQARALAADHTIVRFDLTGAGRSPLAGTTAIETWADDAEAILDAFGIDSAAVVAHSMGTLVAAHLAATRPARVGKLALLGALRAQPDQAKEATRQRAATVRARGMEAVAPGIVAAATSERTRREQPAVAAFVREMLFRQDPAGYAACCEALANAVTPGYSDIKVPVLLIAGSDDKTSPPGLSESLAAEIGSAALTLIDDIGHWHAVEAAAAVTEALRTFL
ncbi:MAG: alpha/beta fold hydrolase [Streptosporangiales bacterium]|nr:alpha/beta fold hydrolase [Streptosporangiales bacterium]